MGRRVLLGPTLATHDVESHRHDDEPTRIDDEHPEGERRDTAAYQEANG